MMINSDDATARNLLSYKPRLLSLLIGALQTETDTCNIQLLLGRFLSTYVLHNLVSWALIPSLSVSAAAMLNVIHDSAAAEHPPTSPEPAPVCSQCKPNTLPPFFLTDEIVSYQLHIYYS